MAHFRKVGIENYRIFKNYTEFDFAPITILTGSNNSGKSSILKILNLLRANFQIKKPPIRLETQIKNIKLGNKNSWLNDNTKELLIKIPKIPVHFRDFREMINIRNDSSDKIINLFEDDFFIDLTYRSGSLNSVEHIALEEVILYDKNKDVLIKSGREQGEKDFALSINFMWFFDFFSKYEIVKNPNVNYNHDDLFYNYNSELDTDTKNKLRNFELNVFKNRFQYYYYNDIVGGGFNSNIDNSNDFCSIWDEDEAIDFINEAIQGSEFIGIEATGINSLYSFEGFIEWIYTKAFSFIPSFDSVYLPTIRGTSNRIYSIFSKEFPINELLKRYLQNYRQKEENKIFIGGKDISEEMETLFSEHASFGKKKDDWKINHWIKRFEIGEELDIQSIEEDYVSLHIKDKKGEKNLADKGFGSTQLVPILLNIELLKFNDEPLMIIEEPESNLHPKMQSVFAEMMVDAYIKHGIRFIIETHSEYLIRKLQYLTAKKKIDHEDLVIYYFNDPENIPEGEDQIKELKIRPDGIMDGDFGPGFFDESLNLTMDLLKLQKNN